MRSRRQVFVRLPFSWDARLRTRTEVSRLGMPILGGAFRQSPNHCATYQGRGIPRCARASQSTAKISSSFVDDSDDDWLRQESAMRVPLGARARASQPAASSRDGSGRADPTNCALPASASCRAIEPIRDQSDTYHLPPTTYHIPRTPRNREWRNSSRRGRRLAQWIDGVRERQPNRRRRRRR